MRQFSRVVVLTGAGISAESGIATFRDSNGLWCNHRVEEVASPEGYDADPKLVHRFYQQRRENLLDPAVGPNAAHLALASLEALYNNNSNSSSSNKGSSGNEGDITESDFVIVTQNVDDLHERGGSKNVLHMHGELLKMRCAATGQVFDYRRGPFDVDTAVCECCRATRTLRPHIVWFGEMPLFMDEIYGLVQRCDLFVSVGTSGAVYPAAGLVREASRHGAATLEINLEEGNNCSAFDKALYGKAGEVVPAWVEQMKAGTFTIEKKRMGFF